MTLETLRKNQIVSLAIPYSSPIRTMDGNLHESGQEYKVLGLYGCGFVRLSRVSDKVKLIIEASRVTLVKDVPAPKAPLAVGNDTKIARTIKRVAHWTESL